MSARLTVMISTLDERIVQVPRLLQTPDERVCYLVVWQHTAPPSAAALEAYKELLREDVTTLNSNTVGLAASRNMAIAHSSTPLLLIADDDVRYTADSFAQIIAAFDARPDVSILCFQAEDQAGKPLQPYPTQEIDYATRPRGYAASSVEIALRHTYDTPLFDTRFGLGSTTLVCGEEDVWLHEAMTRGLKVRFIPHTICSTDGRTTSTRLARHPKFIKTKGASLRVVHGAVGSWLRAAKYALAAPWGEKIWRFKLMGQGIRYIQHTPPVMPLVSIVIPIYNREKTLLRLFESLFAIEHRQVEIILVDNGSTDDSVRLCKLFQAKAAKDFERVALLSESRRGAAVARNTGLRAARGEYVYFFDSDDTFSPSFLTDAAPYLGHYDVVCGRTRMVFDDGRTKVRWHQKPTSLAAQVLAGVVSTQTCLVRRSLFTQEPLQAGWNEALTRWDDLEWGLRVLMAAKSVAWLRGDYHRIYRHADSLSGKSYWEDRLAILHVLQAIDQTLHQYASTLTPNALRQATNALGARAMLAVRRMQRDTSFTAFDETEAEIVNKLTNIGTPRYIALRRTLARLWMRRVPGLWRVLLLFTKL